MQVNIVFFFFLNLYTQIAYDIRGKSRGHGFVTFKDEESMRDAVLMMDGHERLMVAKYVWKSLTEIREFLDS